MFWSIRRFLLNIPDRFRSIVFRLKHGFSREDAWSLDDAVARWLVPRLRYLAENSMSYPGEEISEELWMAILHKMADAFEIIKDDAWDIDNKRAYVEEGLDLFREFFFHLWD